ncbi:Aste57867_7768 [Aphanomyces stellatus]|uniref:Aste57867_3254 protein n=1 Tax=Aphanomyces stellatus TaxID=120398 RepID=A0A485KDM4_9STRA|nr:hypothetical protein As57867_007738 [Aphanomyces stellatus]KAF0715663.1 hypothetical protein As57867_003244 [Aphanomyces stellatus]VFT80426.1 Aste57867_3254 [Aphanomyces stellatus]VFT84668.1 Aste57867_7768 [Aphanomyces stellatus]
MLTAFVESLSPVALISTASCLVLGSLLLHSIWHGHQLRHLPSPKAKSILLGHLADSVGSIGDWRHSGRFPEPFRSWMTELGGIIHVREVLSHAVVLTDPKAVHHVLATNAPNFPRTPATESYLADTAFGYGLVSTRGAVHDQMRKMLNPMFTASHVKTFLGLFDTHTRRLCDDILTHHCESGRPVNLRQLLSHLTLELIGLAGFGFNFQARPDAHIAYEKLMAPPSPLLYMLILSIPGIMRWPLPQLAVRKQAQVELKKLLADIIHTKLSPEAAASTEKPKDLLDLMLPHCTTGEARTHTMTFLLAGHETSTSALSWVFAILASRPDVVADMRVEINSVLAKYKSLGNPEALAELTYTTAVIQETMRLNPVAFVMRRVCEEDDRLPTMDGSAVFIPKGTLVRVDVVGMHRNPRFWHEPELFMPRRFVDGSAAFNADAILRGGKSHAMFYVPFSGGAMNCIGQRFAMAEMQVIVATLVHRFDFTLTEHANLTHSFNGVTVEPTCLDMTVRPRSH